MSDVKQLDMMFEEEDSGDWTIAELISFDEEMFGMVRSVGDYRVVVREDYVALVRVSRGRRLELRGSMRDVVAAYMALVDKPEEAAVAAYFAAAQELYLSTYPDKGTSQGS